MITTADPAEEGKVFALLIIKTLYINKQIELALETRNVIASIDLSHKITPLYDNDMSVVVFQIVFE